MQNPDVVTNVLLNLPIDKIYELFNSDPEYYKPVNTNYFWKRLTEKNYSGIYNIYDDINKFNGNWQRLYDSYIDYENNIHNPFTILIPVTLNNLQSTTSYELLKHINDLRLKYHVVDWSNIEKIEQMIEDESESNYSQNIEFVYNRRNIPKYKELLKILSKNNDEIYEYTIEDISLYNDINLCKLDK
ncbi:Hypothetical protein ORPV_1148 [Orpheovirus IHUMI-LCC2]|uniref:Uncharacterized protein n=1 Tax=Orpheovirus IHUMI-LCC2 TaxID=2023057 RepID=A0A2I2L679_9VIRU|nr:Hypothetical protein ORPV_1148 [Orpheovirus IHUMI-LCC2]SNW63052.1 Hypothetical protein ORPV_1148 [Orpheovirus IHUMI-LCC2]